MADPTPTPPTPTPDPAPVPAPATPPSPTPSPADDDGKGGKDAILADLAKERDKRQSIEKQLADAQSAQQTTLDNIAKALGLKSDETPDPEKLTAQLTTEQAKAREAAVQLAVYRNASAAGANPDALLDSASFLRTLAEVDPTNADAVNAAIKTAIDANPRLKATTEDPFPTAGQAGIGVTGGGSVPGDPRSADLAQIEADLRASKRP